MTLVSSPSSAPREADRASMRGASSTATIAVVVCAYTEARWDELVEAISSLDTQMRPADEIVLVIDHHDHLLARAVDRFPHVRVIPNSATKGLSGARNSGVRATSSEIVAFIDEDARATPEWLARIDARLTTDPELLGVGGSIIPRWMSGRPVWFPGEFLWVVGCTYTGTPTEPAYVRNLIGCNMSIRRTVLERVDGFRIGRVGSLSIGYENDETELCIRARRLHPGRHFLHDPDVLVVDHRVTPARSTFRYFVKRCFSEGVSKGRLTSALGANDGLASEREYLLRTVPAAIASAAIGTCRGRWSDGLRGLAVIGGVLVTGSGFAIGSVLRWTKAGRRHLTLQNRQTAELTAR